MVSNLPSDEPPHPDASPEASGPSRPRRLTLDGSSTVTFEVLQGGVGAGWRTSFQDQSGSEFTVR